MNIECSDLLLLASASVLYYTCILYCIALNCTVESADEH